MPLVERLMGLNADGSTPPSGTPDRPRIPVHHFFAACNEIIAGRLSVAQVKTALAMNASEQTEFDALVATAPATDATRALYVESIHSVFMLAEGGYAGYNTPAGVRAKLGLP